MALQIKIQGGTPKAGKGLCHTCKAGNIVVGQNCEERIICRADMFQSSRNVVTFRVAQCGSYHPSNIPYLHEMEQIAWKVEARRRGPAGFTQPEEGEMELVITKPDSNKNYNVPAPPTSE